MQKYVKMRIILCMLFFFCMGATSCSVTENTTLPSDSTDETNQPLQYGVFIGLNAEDMDVLFAYDIVVIDAAYYTAEEIAILHQNEVCVYSYLNVGSIETFRDAYEIMEPYVLGSYENWDDEYWVDVSSATWQAYVAEQAKQLSDKGVDGFFIDNADVYYYYPNEEIFDGLVLILNALSQYGKDIVINGGDVFVEKAVLNSAQPVVHITGVNQECVFTNIDFEKNMLIKQDAETSLYYKNYLQQCKKAGLVVFVTEYTEGTDIQLVQEIQTYCEDNEVLYYIAPSKWLT